MTSGGTLAAGFPRAAPSFAAATPPSTSGVLSLAVTFPLLTGNWRRASSSASRIWRAFTLQAMATTTAATAAAPSPNQAATAGWLAPWARDSNMSSIKTYDRTIREPVRYIRTERAPAPAPATAAPLYPGQPGRHRAVPEQHLGPGERLERAGRAPGARPGPTGRPTGTTGRC